MRLLMNAASETQARGRLDHALAASSGEERTRLQAVAALWAHLPDAWNLLEVVLGEARHDPSAASPEEAVAAWARTFDRLAERAPEAGVALYSLGDPGLLDRASRDIVDALQGWGDVAPGRLVLDLGCGIGRLCRPLSALGAEVVGVDVSAGMLLQARRRCAGSGVLGFVRLSGRDLAAFAVSSFDLVLAVDVFPYLNLARKAVARRHVEDIARLLRPGGRLVIANFSYPGDDRRDADELSAWLEPVGMALVAEPSRPFALWDGLVFRAQRAR
jgi:SAM-dependent methyltransferase